MIILGEVEPSLFWSVMHDRAFTLFGINEAYLSPQSAERIESRPGLKDSIGSFTLPQAVVDDAIRSGDAKVYRCNSGRLREASAEYARSAS